MKIIRELSSLKLYTGKPDFKNVQQQCNKQDFQENHDFYIEPDSDDDTNDNTTSGKLQNTWTR